MAVILVSACLLGSNCKYNGGNNLCPELVRLKNTRPLLPVCPEELGGLPTPRLPAQFDRAGGHSVLKGGAAIINTAGQDVTENFLRGAYKTLEIARKNGVKEAILKERSPSCGSNFVYITAKGDRPVPGMGVTAALLEQNGIKIYADEKYR